MATTSIDRQSYKQDICKSSYMSIDDTIKVSKALSREDYNSNHPAVDENDIAEDATIPTMQEAHLLVLGTSCASPSPH
jgi:hypothetical protein